MPEERLPSNLILSAEEGVPFAMMQTGKDTFLAVPGETPLGALEALYREKDFRFPAVPCPEPVIGVGERILLQRRWTMREAPPGPVLGVAGGRAWPQAHAARQRRNTCSCPGRPAGVQPVTLPSPLPVLLDTSPVLAEVTIYPGQDGTVLAMAGGGPHVFRTGAGLSAAEALEALYRVLGLPFQPCPCPAYVPVPGERLQLRLRWTPPPGARPHYVVWRETTALRPRAPSTQGDTPARALAAFVSTNR